MYSCTGIAALVVAPGRGGSGYETLWKIPAPVTGASGGLGRARALARTSLQESTALVA